MTTSSSSIGYQFERLVSRILQRRGFQIIEPGVGGGRAEFDLFATRNTESWVIEVKYYRTARAQMALLESAASRLASRGNTVGARRGMLVVSCQLPGNLRLVLEERFSITLVDRADLLGWGLDAPETLDELNALLESDPAIATGASVGPRELTRTSRELPKAAPPEDRRGRELCHELRALDRGKKTWLAYEALCDRILRYLFPNDLHGWHRQSRTDDGLNRFDYVCRIRPATEFWKFLLDHLDSRYVLFEFKNYVGRIKQGQILTTEKYLLERGLRRVAIVFSRAGADINALKMTQGAMRENGKLMLVVNDEQVCEMLHMKERGEDPTDLLFELVDGFLLALPR